MPEGRDNCRLVCRGCQEKKRADNLLVADFFSMYNLRV